MKKRPLILSALLVLMSLSLISCDSKEEKQAKYLERGRVLYEKGDYEKAKLEYKNALRINPVDAEARYRLGLIDEAMGDIRSAFAQFVGAEQQDAHHAPALKKLIQYFLAAQQQAEAAKRLDILLKDLPNDAETRALNAAYLLREKKIDDAEKEAKQALYLDPVNVPAYTVLTGIYVAQENMAKAEETVEEALMRNPKSLPLLLLKAMVYEKDFNLEKIAEAYKEIFALNPTEARFRQEMAEMYVKANKKDEAETILREGVKAAPDNWTMKKMLVAFLDKHKGIDAAEGTIKEYMAQYPEKDELYFWLADLYIANKATERAISLLEQVVDQKPADQDDKNSLNARNSLARIHFVKGDKSLAGKLAEHVLAADTNNRGALFIKAQILADEGDYQQAVSMLRTIVRDNPQAQDALQLLAEVLLAQGYIDLAVDTLEQLVEAAPRSMPAKVRLAQLVALRGDVPRALDLLSLVTKVEADYAVGWESLARIAMGAQKWDVAEGAIRVLEGMKGQETMALFLKSQMLLAKEQTEEAISGLKQVVAADPSKPLADYALSSLSAVMAKAGQDASFTSFVEGLTSQSPAALSLLGDAHKRLKNMQAATAAYERAINMGPTTQDPFLGLALIYHQESKTEQGISLLKKAAQRFPSDARAVMVVGEWLTQQGHYAEAIRTYEDIVSRNPNNDIAANNAAQLIADHQHSDAGALDRARLLSERFIRSTVPQFLDTLAWVYFRQGKNEQALTIFERVMATDKPLPAQIYYHYGASLLKAGNKALALTYLEKALADAETYSGREEAQTMFNEAKRGL